MNDPIIKAYLKKPEPKYPSLVDGKTFPSEEPEQPELPKYEGSEDAQQIQEARLGQVPSLTLKQRQKQIYNFGFASDHDKEVLDAHNSAVHDVIKNGVTPEKLQILDSMHDNLKSKLQDTSLSGHAAHSWYKAIHSHFGKSVDESEQAKLPQTWSRDELIDYQRQAPNIRNKGYTHASMYFNHGPHVDFIRNASGKLEVMPSYHEIRTYMDDNHESDAAKHLEDTHSTHFKNQSHQATKRVTEYTAALSSRLNAYLYHGYHGNHEAQAHIMKYGTFTIPDDHKEYQQVGHEISNALRNAPAIEHETHVFSGLSKKSDIRNLMDKAKSEGKEHSVFHLPAFMSASTKFSVANGFANSVEAHPDELEMYPKDHYSSDNSYIKDVLHVHLPKGYKKGAYVDTISDNRGEKEYILDKAQNMKVRTEPRYTHDMNGHLIRIWHAEPHEGNE